jgi:serine/threonine protein kinase
VREGGGGGGQCHLVYPFFKHGSLDWWLFNGEERRRLLPWPARRLIAVDVAKALAYLHHECHRQIFHVDVKPANILLDGGLQAHVSGTPWNMAPEVSLTLSRMSIKSDVYSYGMTVLELLSGCRSFVSAEDSSSETLERASCGRRWHGARSWRW